MEGSERFRSLVEAARNGDKTAFQAIYEHFGHRIYNFLFRLLGNREEAEDATQQTFLIVLRQLDTLRDASLLESWIYRIARNEVYQKFRRKKAASLDDDEGGATADVLPEERLHANPEKVLLSAELRQVLQAALDGLPVKLREVFVLAVVADLSYQHISEIVGRSLLSVKTDIYRARIEVKKRLRSYLEQESGIRAQIE